MPAIQLHLAPCMGKHAALCMHRNLTRALLAAAPPDAMDARARLPPCAAQVRRPLPARLAALDPAAARACQCARAGAWRGCATGRRTATIKVGGGECSRGASPCCPCVRTHKQTHMQEAPSWRLAWGRESARARDGVRVGALAAQRWALGQRGLWGCMRIRRLASSPSSACIPALPQPLGFAMHMQCAGGGGGEAGQRAKKVKAAVP